MTNGRQSIVLRAVVAALVAAAASGLAGCSWIDPYNMIGRQLPDMAPVPNEVVASPAPKSLPEAERRRAFDAVWATVDDRYHDPAFNGVDWKAVGDRYRPLALAAPDDEAFWEVLDRMAGELHDSHTRVESPKQVELRRQDESITLGFTFTPLDGRLVVTGVHPDADAWWAGVRPGMFLVAIDGQPAMAAYGRLEAATRLASTPRARHLAVMRRLVTGAEGSKVALAFERADGSRIEGTFARRRIPTQAFEVHRVLPSGFGYLRFSQWTLGVMPRVLEALDGLKSAPGLVIDLRGNPGGAVPAVNRLLARFFDKDTVLGTVHTRTGKPVSILFGAVELIKLQLEVEGNPEAYKGPVVILVNAPSASGSELFAGTLQAVGRAKVVGQPTCGCLLGFLGYASLPGGGDLAYSEVAFTMANGKRIEGTGVVPDLEVPPRVEDLRLGRDRALEEAQALLATMAAAK